MGGALLLFALATVSVEYGWQPDDSGGLEYIVQIPPGQLEQSGEITSRIDPRVRGLVSRVVVRIGTDPVPRNFGNLAPNLTVASNGEIPQLTETQVRQVGGTGDVIRGQGGQQFALPSQMNNGPSTQSVTGSSAVQVQGTPRGTSSGMPSTQWTGDTTSRRQAATGGASNLQSFRGAAGSSAAPSTTPQVATNQTYPSTGSTGSSVTSPWKSNTSQATGTRPSTNPYAQQATTGSATQPAANNPSSIYSSNALRNGQQQGSNQVAGNNSLSTFANPSTPLTQGNYQSSTGYQFGQMSQQQPSPQNLAQTGQNYQQHAIYPQNQGSSGAVQPGMAGPLRNHYATNAVPNTQAPLTQVPSYSSGQTAVPMYPSQTGVQQDSRLLVANNTLPLNGMGPLRPAETSPSDASALLLAQQERQRTRELQVKNDSLQREKAALLTDNRTLIDLNQKNREEISQATASLGEVSETLDLEKKRAETMSIFPFFLMVSLVANAYLFIHLARLLQKNRELVTNIRSSTSVV